MEYFFPHYHDSGYQKTLLLQINTKKKKQPQNKKPKPCLIGEHLRKWHFTGAKGKKWKIKIRENPQGICNVMEWEFFSMVTEIKSKFLDSRVNMAETWQKCHLEKLERWKTKWGGTWRRQERVPCRHTRRSGGRGQRGRSRGSTRKECSCQFPRVDERPSQTWPVRRHLWGD